MYNSLTQCAAAAILLCLFLLVAGSENDAKLDPSMTPKQFNPSAFPAMPPELEKVLPADVVQKLKAVHGDMALSIMQKQDKIDRIMSALPGEILDQIPAPPGFERLPDEVKARLKKINRQTEKPWADKQKELQAYVKTLPQEQRAILMMGPMGGPPPPPPSFGRRR
ncbi:hypothetical protein GPALN_013252 [Globodera pallida]|uniref:DUF148 domain-containing protein n=1 Tax=Globodera pallida TaxID=36090 RepID=A0A183C939_GLOPA|nr:hypothetical protein GPALN_013252 [Globodera pallida]